MPQIAPLPPARLHATLNPQRLPWKNSSEIPMSRLARNGRSPFQPRAMGALDLALGITNEGYHIFLSGEAGLGRSHMLLSYLKPMANHGQTPPDLVYVQNFSNPDSPVLLSLPPGQGIRFCENIKDFISGIGANLERKLDTMNFVRERARLLEQFHNLRSELLKKMSAAASNRGFNLDLDENGAITLAPLLKGKKLDETELDSLDGVTRLDLKRKGDNLAKNLIGMMRQLNKAEESLHDDERDLENKAMVQTLNALFNPLEQRLRKMCPSPEVEQYLTALRNDILKNTEFFLPRDYASKGDDSHSIAFPENFINRYSVNLFVDNSSLHGAPVVVENNPTLWNLLGCVERESEMGALVTDFTLIRSGSLHRANGGFLVLHVEDLLNHPAAWEGLLRALRANQARIEDDGEMHETPIRTKGLRPEPLDLSVKVILIGSDDLYEALLINDERFARQFKIKAHMTDVAERTAANIRLYLGQIAQIIQAAQLPPFDAGALAWLVDLGSHLCEDQRRLSLKFPTLREVMIESAALARMRNMDTVTSEILEEAYAARDYRVNLIEESFMEDYDRELIKVSTSGRAIGQVNGLSVTWTGDFEFGLPHRISCTVGVGHDGIIDLEREAELGGPIHTKAMMIIKSYLTDLFARKKPLVLTASLYFEQSYAGIEGDSASGAELAALISALADVPVRLDLAFTGAVSHSGEIMAVGGVTRKIEGFYKICARHGLTGTQGVIIPHDNIDHLMLSPLILESVSRGEFSIYSVKSIEEALFLLTGLPAGKRRKSGGFSKGSLYYLADKKLEILGCSAQNAFRRSRKE